MLNQTNIPGSFELGVTQRLGRALFDGGGWATKRKGEHPSSVLKGNLWNDLETLEGEVDALCARAAESPSGFAAGTVDYDGNYEFGIYAGSGESRWEKKQYIKSQSVQFQALREKRVFIDAVIMAQHYIGAGDIYQVNLSRKFVAQTNVAPFEFYESLRRTSPAPYAAFLEQTGRVVMSASPECFLRMEGRRIATMPIKGTRPRNLPVQADRRQAFELSASAKEQAELLMITDLERNDLGQICEFGSVTVEKFAELQSFAQVHHLVSTVAGKLRENVSQVKALQACFPGGSITGAPKRRSREIIRELELEPRGLYTGAIGWFAADGTSEFSVAIRTVVAEAGTMHFHVGAGIVADSIPEQEWEETKHKAAGILLAAKMGKIGRGGRI